MAGGVPDDDRAALTTAARAAVLDHDPAVREVVVQGWFNAAAAAEARVAAAQAVLGRSAEVWRVTVLDRLREWVPGDTVTVRWPRWGLDSGAPMLIQGVTEDAHARRSTLTLRSYGVTSAGAWLGGATQDRPMANLVIASPALGDAATITASSEVDGAPATHLRTSQPGEVWRSTGTTPALTIDLGASRRVNLIALLYTQCTDAATWTIGGSDTVTNIASAPTFATSGTFRSSAPRDARGWRHGLAWLEPLLGASDAYRYWHIALSDPTYAAGFVQAGRLVVADGWQPGINLDRGWRMRRRDPSEAVRLATGQLRVVERQPWDELTLTTAWLSRRRCDDGCAAIPGLRGGSGAGWRGLALDSGPRG